VEGGGGGGGPGAAAMGGRGRREDWAEGQPPLPWEGAGRGRRTGRRAGAAAMGGHGRREGNGEEDDATREGGLWPVGGREGEGGVGGRERQFNRIEIKIRVREH